MVFSTINSKGGKSKGPNDELRAFGEAFAEAEKKPLGASEGDFTLRILPI